MNAQHDRRVTNAAVLVIVLGLAYWAVADRADRRVIVTSPKDVTSITLTEDEFADVIEATYQLGIKAGIAKKQCRLGDEFIYPPRKL